MCFCAHIEMWQNTFWIFWKTLFFVLIEMFNFQKPPCFIKVKPFEKITHETTSHVHSFFLLFHSDDAQLWKKCYSIEINAHGLPFSVLLENGLSFCVMIHTCIHSVYKVCFHVMSMFSAQKCVHIMCMCINCPYRMSSIYCTYVQILDCVLYYIIAPSV
jgi:hypothetical protein